VFGSPQTELAEDPHLSLRRLQDVVAQGKTDRILVLTCRSDIAEARAAATRRAARRKAQADAEAKRCAEDAERGAMRDATERWWMSLNGGQEQVARKALATLRPYVREQIDEQADPMHSRSWRAAIYGLHKREIEELMIGASRRCSWQGKLMYVARERRSSTCRWVAREMAEHTVERCAALARPMPGERRRRCDRCYSSRPASPGETAWA
jgi:hypothetical protein